MEEEQRLLTMEEKRLMANLDGERDEEGDGMGPIAFFHVVFLTTCAFPIGPKSVTQRVPNFCYIPTSAILFPPKQPQKLHTDLLSVVTTFQKPYLYCSAPKIPLTVASSGAQSALSRRKPPSSSSTSSSSPASQPQSTPTRIVLRESIPFWQQNWFIALLLAMAFAFFALSVFLFLNLDLDQYASFSSASASSSASSSESSSSEAHEVTYGTVLKLAHEKTKFRLHSHDVPYGSGSGQQSVTGFPNVDDANSYWIVRPEPEMNFKQGDAIKSGTIIRLQHMRTRKWLHSHLHASPISGNLEVSCFGGENDSDTGDYWRLMIEGSGKTWKQDQKIRLHHVDTGGYLHSHDKKYQRIAGGQQEVCAVKEKRADNIWLAAEGVYLPTTGSK